jgi:FAD/FMN-containing dehydrogenase
LVKDVAGYEMRKLFVGSYGTLGLLTEVSLRVVPLSLGRRTLLVTAPDLAQGIVWGLAAWRQATCCCGLVLLPRPTATVVPHLKGGLATSAQASEWTLAFTAEGHPADVAAQIELTRRTLLSAGAEQAVETELDATGLWEQVLADGAFVVRAAVAPRDLAGLLADTGAELAGHMCVVDVPGGTLSVAGSNGAQAQPPAFLSTLHAAAGKLGGHAVLMAGPRRWLRAPTSRPPMQAGQQPRAWGPEPESLDLMRKLKARWDPAWILNRGEFIVG